MSRKSIYKWIDRYEQSGAEGLHERSSAPHHHPNATDLQVVEQILRLKARWPHWGAPKLLAWLLRENEAESYPAESTVGDILRRHGLSGPRKRRAHAGAVPISQPLGHARNPNKVWCVDFKGWFRTGDGSKCQPADAWLRPVLEKNVRLNRRAQRPQWQGGSAACYLKITGKRPTQPMGPLRRSGNVTGFSRTGL